MGAPQMRSVARPRSVVERHLPDRQAVQKPIGQGAKGLTQTGCGRQAFSPLSPKLLGDKLGVVVVARAQNDQRPTECIEPWTGLPDVRAETLRLSNQLSDGLRRGEAVSVPLIETVNDQVLHRDVVEDRAHSPM
jgi:hypothetical protein